MRINISELIDTFPKFSVAVIVADQLTITPQRPDDLAMIVATREATARASWGGIELGSIPGIAVWRQAYKAFGIKKTSYRCSVERLVKNACADRPQPVINSFVDAYNAVSLGWVLPIGADDLTHITGDLSFRFARDGDSFLDMAGGDDAEAEPGPKEDPPKPGEVVYADDAHVLCRRWNWRQDARSLVRPQTTRAVLTIQSNGIGDLEGAVADASDLIARFCRGRSHITIVDAHNPVKDLAGI